MGVQSPVEYCRNKYIQENTPFVIMNGQGFYKCKDLLIPKKEFESYYPLGEKIRIPDRKYKGENPDKSWI